MRFVAPHYVKIFYELNWTITSLIVANCCFIPLTVGLIKLKSIQKVHKYFIGLLLLYCFVNIIGTASIIFNKGWINTVSSNIFVLFDFIYIYMMISKWTNVKISKLDIALVLLLIAIWFLENIIYSNLFITNSFFRVLYSICLSIKSIELINKTISISRNRIWLNPYFIIASTFVIYYSYKAIYEAIYLFSIKINYQISINAFKFLIIINLFSYISYAIGIVCMNKKFRVNTSYY